MLSACTAWINSLYLTLPMFHSITGLKKESWNAKGFIQLRSSAITVFLHPRCGMKSIEPARTISLILKLCVTNVFHLTLWSKGRSIGMSTMFNLWTLRKYKTLLNIGCQENTNNKELLIYMDTMLKIRTTKEVLEWSLKPCMSQNKEEPLGASKFYRLNNLQPWMRWWQA